MSDRIAPNVRKCGTLGPAPVSNTRLDTVLMVVARFQFSSVYSPCPPCLCGD